MINLSGVHLELNVERQMTSTVDRLFFNVGKHKSEAHFKMLTSFESQILVSLPEKFWADYVMVVLLPKKKPPPGPHPPNPKSCFPGNSLQAWLPRGGFSETWPTNKSHVSSVKRVIKKLLLLGFFFLL
jgi:hypothetical protein